LIAACRALLYRRLPVGRASEPPGNAGFPRALETACPKQIENLRYGRLKVCATMVGRPTNYRRIGPSVRTRMTTE
jgi:hypothetical protein